MNTRGKQLLLSVFVSLVIVIGPIGVLFYQYNSCNHSDITLPKPCLIHYVPFQYGFPLPFYDYTEGIFQLKNDSFYILKGSYPTVVRGGAKIPDQLIIPWVASIVVDIFFWTAVVFFVLRMKSINYPSNK